MHGAVLYSIVGVREALLCCQVHGFIDNLWIFGAENCLWIFGAENCLWMDQGQK